MELFLATQPDPLKFIGWARLGPRLASPQWAKNELAHSGLEWAGP
ncbi:hypothetical protein PanWU01x14_071770 [Parasponia andersonii]|uniref:Uncharacterized protein n=1 Tax=Parasponia andersonii TaxID=3476 RepID=A0A2P5DEM4_PARAD|nr:hypothetical protein PanWU01x14_071770 [Parasponia andersonii]